MLALDLQRFAGEKTERATPQRRREVRREGRVPRSPELTSALVLLSSLVVLRWGGPRIWDGWLTMMQTQLQQINTADLTTASVMALFRTNTWACVVLLAPVLATALLIGVGVAVAQVGFLIVPKRIMPDFQKISPAAGFRRMWSVQSLAEAVKSILKLLIVAAMAYLAAQNIIGHLADLMTTEIQGLPKVVGGMVAQLGLEISGAFVVLAALDYLFQRYEFERSIRMSREEIKEEMKRQEGDPQIKSQIRQRGRALALRRMMQEVPKADVVITNPTHFAVAIRYDAASMSAPKVVAKGQDELAWRIRKLAEQSGVPRVENRQLAQTLYRTVELDQLIPSELYQAVAEVLAYVYRLRQGG
ncbi:flagellar biosynthesis protein FlhB [Alicyclobacillus contaminans]|uniref:flagellar biosynthesis protein FlhB n=1 Tax=Alicyclobacillus contaminans TaxID=392016 RepID=UPI0004279A60|nr:flagellar biosynthesis protein FlhB [Alicyclobacillus contaminans]